LIFDRCRLVDNSFHFVRPEARRLVTDNHFDQVGSFVERLPHGFSRVVRAGHDAKFLVGDLARDRRMQRQRLSAWRSQLSRRRLNPRARNPAGVDRVAQGGVAIDATMADDAHGCEPSLEILARITCTEQRTL
jgi:hypothetical protein